MPAIPLRSATSWFRMILRVLVLLILLALLAGFLYQNISEARDRRFHPMRGKFIDIGGYKLHIHCTGQAAPAVIFVSGLGDSFISWEKVQPEIAKFAQVCSYDRAGLGYSDPSPRPPTSKEIAEELHTLLHNAAIPGPIILVGHSAGGYHIRLYASLYRDEVAGLIFIDSSHPDQESRFPAVLRSMEGRWLREAEFLGFAMPFGIPRMMGFCDSNPEIRAAECNFRTARGGIAEMKAFDASAAQAAATGPFGNIPLAVLSRDPEKPSSDFPPDLAKFVNQAWEKMQEDLAHLSIRGTQGIAKNSGHYIQEDRPDLVIDTIHRVVNEARPSQP